MMDKKIDEKETLELKKRYNHYLDKTKEIMNTTQFNVEDVFGNVISKDSSSSVQISKPNDFLTKECEDNHANQF